LKKYSSTYKILHGNLQQIFGDDSSSDADDAGSQKKVRNKGSDSAQQQLKAKNDVQICRKPNVVSMLYLRSYGILSILSLASGLVHQVSEVYLWIYDCFSSELGTVGDDIFHATVMKQKLNIPESHH
jgi:hypothetical protein